MKIKTTELTGAALDWAVATALNAAHAEEHRAVKVMHRWVQRENEVGSVPRYHWFSPSTDPADSWPIIDREGISIVRCDDDYGEDAEGFTTSERIPVWGACIGYHSDTTSTEHTGHEAMYQLPSVDMLYGPTALIAAMRCFVAWVFGDEIEVPDELLEPA